MEAGGVLVARQPVFDRALEVEAYLLVARAAGRLDAAAPHDDSAAAARLLSDAFLEMDVRAVTAGRPVLLQFDRDLLVGDAATVLPPSLAGVALAPDVVPDQQVVAACKALRAQGYRIGIGELVVDDPRLGMLPADFVTARLGHGVPAAERVARAARRQRLRLVALGVDEAGAYRVARAAGADATVGEFFKGTALIRGRRITGTRLAYLRLLALVNAAEIDFAAVETAIKHDVSLSWKFLNYTNAAFFGWRQRITSIRHGLVLLGQQGVRKWVSLMSIAGLADGLPPELMSSAVARARFTELLAEASTAQVSSLEAFLGGMFSLLDALLDEPIGEVLAQISVPEAVADAILHGQGELGALLALVGSYERGAWDGVAAPARQLGLEPHQLLDAYLSALAWAGDRVPDAEDAS